MQSTNYVPFDALCYFIRVQEKEPLSPLEGKAKSSQKVDKPYKFNDL